MRDLEDIIETAEKWQGETEDADGRSWWPEWFLDEVMPPGRPSPQDWLDALPEERDDVPIKFCWQRRLGEFDITRSGARFTGLPEASGFPESAAWWILEAAHEVLLSSNQRLSEALFDACDEAGIADGETFTLMAIEWSTSKDSGLVWHLSGGRLVEHGGA